VVHAEGRVGPVSSVLDYVSRCEVKAHGPNHGHAIIKLVGVAINVAKRVDSC
jgi:hypothetical protein